MLRASLFIALLATLSAMVFHVNPLVGAVYLLSMLAVFGGMMSMACTRCDYYFGVCDNGLSVLTRHLFRQRKGRSAFGGQAKRLLLPLIILTVFPIGLSLHNLVRNPSLLTAGLLAVLLVIGTLIYITSMKLACPRCSMHDVCPLGRLSL